MATLENGSEIPFKTKNGLTYNSAIALLDIYPIEIKTFSCRNLYPSEYS